MPIVSLCVDLLNRFAPLERRALIATGLLILRSLIVELGEVLPAVGAASHDPLVYARDGRVVVLADRRGDGGLWAEKHAALPRQIV